MDIAYFVITLYLLQNAVEGDGTASTWRYITACYGSDPVCSDYKIECGAGERIVIGSLKYGGKRSISECSFGISNCHNTLTVRNVTKTLDTWCCQYDPIDYLTEFNLENRTKVMTNCNGRQKCSGIVPRVFRDAYSSYVWMQYTCIRDDTSIEMCSKSRKSGLDIFVTFNLSQGYSFPSLNGSRDCSCQVHTLDCSTNLEVTVVAFNGSQSQTVCSNAYLQLSPVQKLECGFQEKFSFPVTFRNISWKDKLAVRHLFWNGSTDRPDLVVLQVKAVHTRSPIVIDCYQPGVEPTDDMICPYTISKQTTLSSTTQPKLNTDMSTIITKKSSVRSLPSTTQPRTYQNSETHMTQSGSISKITTHSSLSSMLLPKFSSQPPDTLLASTEDSSQTMDTTPSISRATSTSYQSESTSNRVKNSLSEVLTTTTDSLVDTSSVFHIMGLVTEPEPDSTLSNSVNLVTERAQTIDNKPTTTTDLTAQNNQTATFTPFVYDPTTNPSNDTTESSKSHISTTDSLDTSTTLSVFTDTVTSSTAAGVNRLHNTTRMHLAEKGNGSTSDFSSESSVSSVIQRHTSYSTDQDYTMFGYLTTPKGIEQSDNKKLIIGLTVGAVLIIIIVAAIIAVCCYTRLKRKERVQRSYVRNTNIFYSFPEDYYVTENMSYEPADTSTDDPRVRSSHLQQCSNYERVGGESPESITRTKTLTLPIDDYLIKRKLVAGNSDFPTDQYQTDVANGTVEFINGTEPDVIAYTTDLDDVDNGTANGKLGTGRSVTFDPRTLEKVRKEGQTKF